MSRIDFYQNFYDVMRQIIENSVDGQFKCQASVNKGDRQYWVEANYTIKELHFEKENEFKPMKEQTE